ncbi:MAG TPA: DUF3352 domain-containing protein [Baekduia sp.]|nr:DUF3352 domain-containing protein [Baekduia sp.]
MPFPFLPRPLAALAAAAALAIPVAGCGGGGSSSGGDAGADPAAALPPAAPLYVEAQVRPDGDLAASVESVGRKLLNGRDPGQELVRALDDQLHEEGANYQQDIEPWLGDRVGVAILSLGSGKDDTDGVVALASKDDDRAQAYLDREKDATKREYRGVQYLLKAKDDEAAAVLDGRVLIGSERGVKAAIDATKGDSLAESKQFQEARDAVSTDGLGFLYVDPRRAIEGVSAQGSSASDIQGQQAVKGLLAGLGLRAVAASIDVHDNAIVGDMAALGAKSGDAHGDSAAAAAAAPDSAWLSVGVGDVGGTIERALDQWGGSGATAGGVDPQALLQQLKAGLGLDVQKDFLDWMGDATIFVEGTNPSTLGGALVVQSKDPAASKRAIAELRSLLPRFGAAAKPLPGLPSGATGLLLPGSSGLPGGVQIAAKGDVFVVAVGQGALADALEPKGTVGSTDAFKTAAGLLDGAKPSFFLDTPKAVRLVEGLAAGDPDFAKAKPTLDAFGPAAAGGTSQDGVSHVKAGVAVP